MAATNFTPISLYFSTTAAAVPTSGNLVAGELALNTLDEKLYFKNSAGTVKLLASNASTGATVSSVAMSVPAFLSVAGSPITSSGTLAVTLSGTALPVVNGGTGVTTSTGSGNNVLSTSPTLVTPLLGTPTSGVATNLTGLPLTTGVTGTLPIANGGTGTTSTTFANLTTNVTGTLPVANGGTGIQTTTAYGVVFAGTTATGPFQAAAGPGTATHVLTSNGTGALPTFQAPAASGITAGKSIAFAMIFGF